nr:immunoglobulin heavy chain junction region [Mus musculus]MBK4188212.1 immunoglobulin heavy chain junction region [Mus musculus]MBK4188213.1 immunoglobulin heavy chain junction region [Mus musculus]MBK4188214.1 immunoglobulin heavy chain junction region [Mus musculus]MBK4188215.1 immunoglobulin heavy chain junction region [Mus musculus]
CARRLGGYDREDYAMDYW